MAAAAPVQSAPAAVVVQAPSAANPAEPAPTPAVPPPAPPPAAPPAATADPAATTEAGEVLVIARSKKGDPLQSVNVETFGAAQSVDKALVGPLALAYKKNAPKPFRKGLRNFLNNLREPVVFVNYVLQLKPGKAAETAGRFALNSTIGVAGLFDMAKRKPFGLPRRRNGFANTLGYYGVKPGPFFFVPLIGPTTLRDLIGNLGDQFVPIGPIRPFHGSQYTIPIAVLSALDYRAEFDDELERQRATRDPYTASKTYYLRRRQAEIDQLKGKPPAGPVETPSPAAEEPVPATR